MQGTEAQESRIGVQTRENCIVEGFTVWLDFTLTDEATRQILDEKRPMAIECRGKATNRGEELVQYEDRLAVLKRGEPEVRFSNVGDFVGKTWGPRIAVSIVLAFRPDQ